MTFYLPYWFSLSETKVSMLNILESEMKCKWNEMQTCLDSDFYKLHHSGIASIISALLCSLKSPWIGSSKTYYRPNSIQLCSPPLESYYKCLRPGHGDLYLLVCFTDNFPCSLIKAALMIPIIFHWGSRLTGRAEKCILWRWQGSFTLLWCYCHWDSWRPSLFTIWRASRLTANV